MYLLGTFIAHLLKSRRWLEVENLFLRHQLNIILRRPSQRLRLHGSDRALMVWMTRLWPSLPLARVVQPATILRWHRAGFRTYWRWKSQGRPGRPRIEHELRDLIRRMSKENPLWERGQPFQNFTITSHTTITSIARQPDRADRRHRSARSVRAAQSEFRQRGNQLCEHSAPPQPRRPDPWRTRCP
jgi:hypothetical protein